MRISQLSIAVVITFLSGCAVHLSSEAENVKLVSASEKERCERIKLITSSQHVGPDKSVNAMKKALNEAALVGANSFYVASTSMDPLDGASVVGEALRCNK